MHKYYEQLCREKKLVFDRNYKHFVRAIRKRLRQYLPDGRPNTKDMVILLAGERGSAKTSLGINLSYCIDDDFDIETKCSVVPDADVAYNMITNAQNRSSLLLDEGIMLLYKMEFQSRDQKKVIKIFDTARFRNLCLITCVPRFTDLNEQFRNSRVLVLIMLTSQGHANVILKDRNQWSRDPWHSKIMEKFCSGKYINFDAVTQKHPKYIYSFDFPPMPKEIEEKYQAFRKKCYEEDEQKAEEQLTKPEKELKDTLREMVKGLVMQGMSANRIIKLSNGQLTKYKLNKLMGIEMEGLKKENKFSTVLDRKVSQEPNSFVDDSPIIEPMSEKVRITHLDLNKNNEKGEIKPLLRP